jgi:hypothetical protein
MLKQTDAFVTSEVGCDWRASAGTIAGPGDEATWRHSLDQIANLTPQIHSAR